MYKMWACSLGGGQWGQNRVREQSEPEGQQLIPQEHRPFSYSRETEVTLKSFQHFVLILFSPPAFRHPMLFGGCVSGVACVTDTEMSVARLLAT